MIYVTGDTHGEMRRLYELDKTLKEGDFCIVCGDFGYVFLNDVNEKHILNDMEARPYTYIFADGNHENFDALEEFPVVNFNGARAHKIRENIFHILRGEIFTLEGKSFFVFGGGYSVDKYMRREGVSWWKQELPVESEYKTANENLDRVNRRVDYIITHTAPLSALEYLKKYHGEREYPLNNFLEYIKESCTYKKWFFGHLHIEHEIEMYNLRALYFDIVKIK